jgi:hypothetical protein
MQIRALRDHAPIIIFPDFREPLRHAAVARRLISPAGVRGQQTGADHREAEWLDKRAAHAMAGPRS